MSLRPEVASFAEMMEQVLAENDWKSGWKATPNLALFDKLKAEVSELDTELRLNGRVYPTNSATTDAMRRLRLLNRQRHRQQAIKECVDVANFALMIADNLLTEIEGEAHD